MKRCFSLLTMLCFFALAANAQTYTKVNDAYVFQVLEQANSMTLQSTNQKSAVFETNATNKQYWINAKNILSTNPPTPSGTNSGVSMSALQSTIDYIDEVVATMNTKL